jgi:Oxidoreductase molybdopterin binding domain
MPRRLTNDLLLLLVVAQVATGVVGWALPVASALPLYEAHRLLGAGLVGVLVWKWGIARGSLVRRIGRRRDASVVLGLLAAVALLGTVGLGLAWILNLLSFDAFWGYSAMNVHTALGIAVLPVLVPHALKRFAVNGSTFVLPRRRTLVRLGGIALGAVVGSQLLEAVAALGAPMRRPSGSKHAASYSGNAYPAEIWLFDGVPTVDAADWRLRLDGKLGRPGELTLEELTSLPRSEVRAVLDCTGGWWTEQAWQGVATADLLDARGLDAAARQASVTSLTGHTIVLPIDEFRQAVLATHVGGEPLTPEHGYPVRLAMPGRRGYHWVKWVASIELS